ncbi:hypothetical protein CKAN_01238100 [Cinnamomum micranthum f. kanehirae]|uniref:Uncharacterized protein n=1 Tax=Cinnamomum micranthum f. kanehirae TaxID=337451 RepID=A0A3S3N1G2_9MAGN|nr:hypothetical protein CKAN_01238100 [Cinnamomum micranthum f. kanehirae]
MSSTNLYCRILQRALGKGGVYLWQLHFEFRCSSSSSVRKGVLQILLDLQFTVDILSGSKDLSSSGNRFKSKRGSNEKYAIEAFI